MKIIITEWALNSYLELKSQRVFDSEVYRSVIRPDILRLKSYPDDPKFNNGKFWSPAQDRNNERIPFGFKMKWHQIGNGKVQLRLTIGLFGNESFLCEAYVKKDEKTDRRMLSRFKVFLELIREERYTICGSLT